MAQQEEMETVAFWLREIKEPREKIGMSQLFRNRPKQQMFYLLETAGVQTSKRQEDQLRHDLPC